jgi:ABC-2 type transport system permease protein
MMKALFSVLAGSFRAEILHLMRSRLFVALTIIQAITFLFLVSLFGLTGSRAPTAIVTEDEGHYAKAFIKQLASTYNSFDLRAMDASTALAALHRGSLVAVITIPGDFSYALAHGQEVTLQVAVDNVNTDMTDDIQRALPAAIVAFGRQQHLPDIRVQGVEIDLINHDTGFIPYLVVSGLALDAFIIASILSAMSVAREFETRTIKLLAVAPVHPLLTLLGRMLATDTMAVVAMMVPVAIAVFGYHIIPLHPFEVAGVMLLCVAIFGCIGVALGAVLRRTLPVVSLIFGLGFPFYLGSGSLEPQRFDGDIVWGIAHVSPVYYAVGILEQAFHGLQVTPEPLWADFLALFGWAALTLPLAAILLRTALLEKGTTQERLPGGRRPGSVLQPHIVLLSARWLFTGLILLAIGGTIWFSEQQHQADTLRVQQQQQAALATAEDQRETRLLNDYMLRISSLVPQDLQHAKTTNVGISNSTRATATALTQKLLGELNTEHKARLLRYLHERKLIDDDFRVVNLHGADFQGCKLVGLDLSDTDMSGANFSNADLHNANLNSTTLISTNFSGANLAGADLKDADMHNDNIANANLASADLAGVIGKNVEQLLQARSLAGARLPDGSVQPGEVHDTD